MKLLNKIHPPNIHQPSQILLIKKVYKVQCIIINYNMLFFVDNNENKIKLPLKI